MEGRAEQDADKNDRKSLNVPPVRRGDSDRRRKPTHEEA